MGSRLSQPVWGAQETPRILHVDAAPFHSAFTDSVGQTFERKEIQMNLRKTAGIVAVVALMAFGATAPSQAADANRQAQKEAFQTAVTQYKAAMTDYKVAMTQYKAAMESRKAKLEPIRAAFRAAVEAAKAGAAESRNAAKRVSRGNIAACTA